MGLRQVRYGVGGDGPMDLIYLTPKEYVPTLERITPVAAVVPEAVELLPGAVATSRDNP